jgi:hypothetical protein
MRRPKAAASANSDARRFQTARQFRSGRRQKHDIPIREPADGAGLAKLFFVISY